MNHATDVFKSPHDLPALPRLSVSTKEIRLTRLLRKRIRYLAVPTENYYAIVTSPLQQKEAGRLVMTHKAGP